MTTKINSYIERDIQYLKNLDSNEIKNLIRIIASIGKGRIYIAGNGGSAATALHFSTDLKLNDKKLLITCLNENQALLTALSNDYGYIDVFKLQLEGNFTSDDILIVISASGESGNLIEAVRYVNSIGGTVIGILGFDGGELLNLCKHTILVKAPLNFYEEVEDIHLAIIHIIAKYFKTNDVHKRF